MEQHQRSVGVGVFIYNSTLQAILLGRRGPGCRSGQGCFALPGGMIEPNETVAALIEREVLEETGLTVQLPPAAPLTIPGLLAVTDHLTLDGRPHLSLWIITHYVGGQPLALEPNKCDGWQWYDAPTLRAIHGSKDPSTEQYLWTPLPLWQHLLQPYLDI